MTTLIDATPPLDGEYDYIVVGGGTAGCVLANRLTENPRSRVLLLEAGGTDRYHWVRIPVGYLYCIGNPRTDWMMRTAEEPGLNGRSIAYPRGKLMGGCSSINGMIYMRGQAADYDHWRQIGNVGWGWSDVLPYFLEHVRFSLNREHALSYCFASCSYPKSRATFREHALKSEDHHAGDGPMHHTGGEWKVQKQKLRWEILNAVQEGAREFGILPRRWVVERTFAWLGRCRRLAKDWKRSIESATAWAFIASIRTMTRRIATHCYAS